MTGQLIKFSPRLGSIKRGHMGQAPVRVISITSGKGGVGKSTVAVNLGVALAKLGKRVLLLDADLGLANINILLGFESAATLQQVIEGRASLADVVVHHESGCDIIPAASGVQELTSLNETSRLALVAAVDSLGDSYDYMLVDTAAGIGDNVMYFNLAAEDIIVVIDPEPTSLTDAYALIKVLSSTHGVHQFFVLANRTTAAVDGRDIYAQLAAATDKFLKVSLKYLGSVADDESVSEAIIAQKALLNLYPGSRASLDISKLARKLDGEKRIPRPSGGLQFFFRSLIENQANNL